MPNEDDRLTGHAPMSEKCADVVLAAGVVAWAKQRFVKSLLRVHHDESVSHRVTVPPSRQRGNTPPKQPRISAQALPHRTE